MVENKISVNNYFIDSGILFSLALVMRPDAATSLLSDLDPNPVEIVNKTSKVIAENCTVSQFALTSQARYDTWVAQIERLILLKSARNQANTITMVTVNGKQMTMDEAISKKAMLEVQKTALNKFKSC